MKQISKKLLFPVLVVACTLMLSACSTSEDIGGASDSSMDDALLYSAESLTETIIDLNQDDIDAYLESGDDFTVSAMEAWENNRDELGEYEEITSGKVEDVSDGYTVTEEVSFSGHNGEFVYSFDESGTPTALEITPLYTFGEQMQQAGMNTIMGICIVFVLLIVLALLISLFRFLPFSGAKKAQKEEQEAREKQKAVQPEQAPAVSPAVQESAAGQEADDKELVAVIAAAIAAYEGTSTDGFVVRSIKKSKRKKW